MAVKPTHYLICRHVIGKNKRTYTMPCTILKLLPNNMVSVRVYGDRTRPKSLIISRVRRVARHRVKFLPR